jgi:hypothetical protein
MRGRSTKQRERQAFRNRVAALQWVIDRQDRRASDELAASESTVAEQAEDPGATNSEAFTHRSPKQRANDGRSPEYR